MADRNTCMQGVRRESQPRKTRGRGKLPSVGARKVDYITDEQAFCLGLGRSTAEEYWQIKRDLGLIPKEMRKLRKPPTLKIRNFHDMAAYERMLEYEEYERKSGKPMGRAKRLDYMCIREDLGLFKPWRAERPRVPEKISFAEINKHDRLLERLKELESSVTSEDCRRIKEEYAVMQNQTGMDGPHLIKAMRSLQVYPKPMVQEEEIPLEQKKITFAKIKEQEKLQQKPIEESNVITGGCRKIKAEDAKRVPASQGDYAFCKKEQSPHCAGRKTRRQREEDQWNLPLKAMLRDLKNF